MMETPSSSASGGSESARNGSIANRLKRSTIISSRNEPAMKTKRSIPTRMPRRMGIPGNVRVRMLSGSVRGAGASFVTTRSAIRWAKLCRLAAMIWATVIRCRDSISSAIVRAASRSSGFSPIPWRARRLSRRSAENIFPRLRTAAST